ncbi:hypothetical protein HDV05_008802 [Chytridiales sp. JEL 0842]|nr:hypothetical protein HDV05_008802 [Chytridiales sp. JEL 0842]
MFKNTSTPNALVQVLAMVLFTLSLIGPSSVHAGLPNPPNDGMKYRGGTLVKKEVFHRLIQFKDDKYKMFEDEMNAYAKSLQYMQIYNEYIKPLDKNATLKVMTGTTAPSTTSRPSAMDEKKNIIPLIKQFAKTYQKDMSAPIGVFFLITPPATSLSNGAANCGQYCGWMGSITKAEAGTTTATSDFVYALLPDLSKNQCHAACRTANHTVEEDIALAMKRSMINILTNPMNARDLNNVGWRDYHRGWLGTICPDSYRSTDISLKYPNPMKANHDHNYYSKVDYQNHYNNDYNTEKVDYNNDHHQTLDNNNDYNSEKVDYNNYYNSEKVDYNNYYHQTLDNNNYYHQTLDNNNYYNPEKVDYNNYYHQTLDNHNPASSGHHCASNDHCHKNGSCTAL